MTSVADWKNCHQTHTNKANEKKGMNVPRDATHTDKKYEQLDSNIFGIKPQD
jgi:hypothetical protein